MNEITPKAAGQGAGRKTHVSKFPVPERKQQERGRRERGGGAGASPATFGSDIPRLRGGIQHIPSNSIRETSIKAAALMGSSTTCVRTAAPSITAPGSPRSCPQAPQQHRARCAHGGCAAPARLPAPTAPLCYLLHRGAAARAALPQPSPASPQRFQALLGWAKELPQDPGALRTDPGLAGALVSLSHGMG